MLVKEIMNRDPVMINPDSSIRDAIATMNDNHIGSVIVVKENKIVGILTDRDVLVALAEEAHFDIDLAKVGDIMTHWVITISSEDSVEKAVRLMEENNIKKLPVVNVDRLVGIITSTDIAMVEPRRARELREKIARERDVQLKFESSP